MRLVCPNCSAQYEIDASAIPDEGRDVQCSNCGHTWFELPAPPVSFAEEDALVEPQPEFEAEISEPEPEPTEPETSTAEDDSDWDNEPDDVDPSEAEPEIDPEPEVDDGNEPDSEEADKAALTPPSPTTRELEDEEAAVFGVTKKPERRPAASDDAIDILREEAEREIKQRRAMPSVPLETQTDMELDTLREPATPSRALRARMARAEEDDAESLPKPKGGRWRNKFGKGKDQLPAKVENFPDQPEDDEAYQEPRRDLLPDIEEINSTLSATNSRDKPAPEVVQERQRGFRQGFVIPIAIASILILAYVYAPAIANQVPATEPALLAYVDLANGAREMVDGIFGK